MDGVDPPEEEEAVEAIVEVIVDVDVAVGEVCIHNNSAL